MDRSVISRSLLESIAESQSRKRKIFSLFCLRLEEYCKCEKCTSKKRNDETEAPSKRLKLSLPKDKPRFTTPLPCAKMAEMSQGKKCVTPKRVLLELLVSLSSG